MPYIIVRSVNYNNNQPLVMTRLDLSAKCNINYEFITMLQRFSIKYLIFIYIFNFAS